MPNDPLVIEAVDVRLPEALLLMERLSAIAALDGRQLGNRRQRSAKMSELPGNDGAVRSSTRGVKLA